METYTLNQREIKRYGEHGLAFLYLEGGIYLVDLEQLSKLDKPKYVWIKSHNPHKLKIIIASDKQKNTPESTITMFDDSKTLESLIIQTYPRHNGNCEIEIETKYK